VIYYCKYNRKTNTICQVNCFKTAQLVLDISNEELINKLDWNQIIAKPVIASNDKDIGKVDDTEEFGLL
jgi:hypothetical protein